MLCLKKFGASRHYTYSSRPKLTRKTRAPSLGREILQKVRKCLSVEANRREFEAWYFDRYGQNYHWKGA